MTDERLRKLHDLIKAWIDREEADGCSKCKYEDTKEWEQPCSLCSRNHKDYYEIDWGGQD